MDEVERERMRGAFCWLTRGNSKTNVTRLFRVFCLKRKLFSTHIPSALSGFMSLALETF